MISTFVVGKWLEIEVIRKFVIPFQNYKQNQFWQCRIYRANTLMHFVTWRNQLNPHTAFIFPLFDKIYLFPLFNKWVLRFIITGLLYSALSAQSRVCPYYLLNFSLITNLCILYEFDFQIAFKSQLCTRLSTTTIISEWILCTYVYNIVHPG